ncbi:hypothetical protein BD410DRAFT_234577 [Rickenella mellea]|uniref:Pal1-domain-containing protein n=1 Tax=Rickenella mellea TaxID=50990 RepID=A0A4Y7QN05_9AGAM|nr:hypothetical protein BD410DRAFT_234577 [Rickenella mellea]
MVSSNSHHRRQRSSSNPFVDPIVPAPYSHSDSTNLPRSAPPFRSRTMPESPAVHDPRPVDPSPRVKAPSPSRRSYSQDSVTQAARLVEKARTKTPKKGSTHADVIDRLDFTGVGPMFHHDGPFDACAPSRNRHKTKAPMLAWSRQSEEQDEPMSAAHLRAERRHAPVDNMAQSNDSPYPAFGAYNGPTDTYPRPKKQVDRIAEAWGIHEPEPYEEFMTAGGAKPEGETGLASAASSIYGGRESHNSSMTGTRNRGAREGRELREQFKEYLDDGRPAVKRTQTRTNLPPPQPIFLPNSSNDADADLASLPQVSPGLPSAGTGQPKRSKSLMHKIRKMRDAPNVPVDSAEVDDASPPSSLENYAAATPIPDKDTRPGRPAHRSSNSFFGRFGRNTSGNRNPASPTSPTSEASENFVYVEDPKIKNKALPPRPPPLEDTGEKDGYFFDGPSNPIGATPGSPGGGVGRRTSILRKVKGVVRPGGKQ